MRRNIQRTAMMLVLAGGIILGTGACATNGDSGGTNGSPPASSHTPDTANGTAEISTAAPNCKSSEIIEGMDLKVPASASTAHAPKTGRVPDGFTPVKVLWCSNVKTGGVPVTDADEITVYTLAGDLSGLMTQLQRPNQTATSTATPACPAKLEIKPQIFLVDSDGRNVRPAWPTDACGFMLDGERDAFDSLVKASGYGELLEAS